MARVAVVCRGLALAALASAGGTATARAECTLRAYDARSRLVDPTTSHATLSRSLPAPVATEVDGSRDLDALTWVLACPKGHAAERATIASERPSGEPLDALADVPLRPFACPPDTAPALECETTGPIRASVDFVDRAYPVPGGHAVLAEVGGAITVSAAGLAVRLLVGGPAGDGAAGRYRGKLRFHVLRAAPGGMPAVGGTDAGAVRVAHAEARIASMLWGQCGVHFGQDADTPVEVVDPPEGALIGVGCDLGLPASGGTVAFRIGGQRFHVATHPGDSPAVVAHAVARALEGARFGVEVSPNPRIEPGAGPTADVLVRDRAQALVRVERVPGEPLSTDATLRVCIGRVRPEDGLDHFDDLDAVAGTLEERALVKAYDDGDPTTIDVFVVPAFGKTGRIGESFIDLDGSEIENVVIIDRAGIRAGSRSYALAHEIGHVLLDLTGHPDDFGVDRPWQLMDADATDATVFGPRRLSLEDCRRAILQSGPGAPAALLVPWPLREPSAPDTPREAAQPPLTGVRSR